ncbi:MBL fold metallo-hydrolase [Parafilimonas terrae]|uniref:Glyoxylase, beta-lactamase superfamily II n=1 Tax=Parafilimonas terrae TaxID=1465490 RepID=A0A1I5Z3K3_9BACT|nr:MBL fold metallo-hydrolase [Parafilimonas terrae]SFQ50895.1 Glyoxylase, beta-lactamase superfamily II [Parafilimonas terrae]
MYIEQLYTGCLSEAAYYIESEGEAAIVDPMRDIEGYIALAKQRNATIKYIFETHFHADFVSGHLDLSKATGAPVIYGPNTKTALPVHIAKDGEIFSLGKLQIEVLHTPGHTLESSCYLLRDENNKDHAIFTGDTLFVGDVGRPDLAQKDESLTADDLAGIMYDSLQQKIMPLSDEVIVYPAHGAGSSCGKNIGPQTSSTIGNEKQNNYALQAVNKEEFIKAVTEGLSAPPQYFPINAKINKEGYESIDAVLEKALKPLSVQEVKNLVNNDEIILLDTRPAAQFTAGFIPNSIFIGLDGRFAEWAGSILPFDKTLLLITEQGKEKESVVRLARVGFSRFAGYIDGGFDAWKATGGDIDMVINVEADELAMDIPFDEKLVVIDVRRETEFADGHVKDAVNISLDSLTDPGSMANIEDDQNLYLHCASGFRSVIAASLLKRQGIHNLYNVLGGWNKIKLEEKIETEKEKSILN